MFLITYTNVATDKLTYQIWHTDKFSEYESKKIKDLSASFRKMTEEEMQAVKEGKFDLNEGSIRN